MSARFVCQLLYISVHFVGFGSRLCKNVGFEATGAIMAIVRKRGRNIVAVLANVMIHYFVLVAENLFLHMA